MESIHYCPIERKDYFAVSKVISRSFGLHRYIPEPSILQKVEMQYLYSCLAEATYTCVAEKAGEIIGIIMGKADSNYRIYNHISHMASALWYGLKIRLQIKKCLTGIQDYQDIHKVYQSFSKKHKGEFDGVLTLFAVEEMYRGYGVGKFLLFGLFQYLSLHGTKRIYLYTDTTCNVGFYEHHGFTRLEEERLSLTRDGKPFWMDVYLYGYQLEA